MEKSPLARSDERFVIVLEWTIDAAGGASRVYVVEDETRSRGEVAKCLGQMIRNTRFPRVAGQPLRVRYMLSHEEESRHRDRCTWSS